MLGNYHSIEIIKHIKNAVANIGFGYDGGENLLFGTINAIGNGAETTVLDGLYLYELTIKPVLPESDEAEEKNAIPRLFDDIPTGEDDQ